MRVDTFQPTNLFALADKMLRSFEKFKTAYFKQVKMVNAQDSFGFTLLHYAVARGRIDIVEFLLEQGANPTIKNWLHISPLDIAVEDEKTEIIAKLNEKLAQMKIAMRESMVWLAPTSEQTSQQFYGVKVSFEGQRDWQLAI